MAIKFGTDGWRGIIADDFTFANVAACAQALSDYLKEHGEGNKPLVVGYDTRFASESFAAICAEVAAANGIRVLLSSKALPTPVTSYAVVNNSGSGAIMITASHNPPQWNGFKVKSDQGYSVEPKVTSELEQRIEEIVRKNSANRMPFADAQRSGYVKLVDLETPYLDHISRLVDLDALKKARLNVIVDSMHGSGAGYLRRILSGGALQVTEIHCDANPAFPEMHQPEPIAQNLGRLIESFNDKGYSVGLATDGDADRLGVVDQAGTFLTQLQVFALLALYLLEIRGERGALVKTTTTTGMIFKLAELYGVKAFETPVGFKYVAPVMIANDALIGGEESGGYGFRGHVPERDGILAALYFLDFMVKTGKTPTQLIDYLYSKVGPHHYDRIDIAFNPEDRPGITSRFASASPKQILGKAVARVDRTEGARFIFSDGSWLFMRLSGTEPIMRIYAESPSLAESASLLRAGKEIAGV